ncbi:MAG TPA: MBL fold metallo-hydrolase [Patescibacteria group bacterium]|jgi:L-ascorbate metabolism protein UlaG (beta-lactamase superfamily)|nr:MBL fold metallo-hydrolase [Patescibacteria group bacterium]
MKITKYVHSCLLVETPDRVGIIDPGEYSWQSDLLDITKLARLDDIIITHEHIDHMCIPFIEALLLKFPAATIFTTNAASVLLQKAGIKNVQTQGQDGVELLKINHESTAPFGDAPENTGVHYLGQLTHPGDSQTFTESKPILALPLTAPWGTLTKAAELGLALKPNYIIPIHDWHWNDTARNDAYIRLELFFKNHGISFIQMKDGNAVEL